MPFDKTCGQCGGSFTAQKQAAKFCSLRCFGLSRADITVANNKARRKYAEVPGLTRRQVWYRNAGGADRLRDVEKRHNLLIALGGECVLCGYDKDLRGMVLDHKHGDGGEDRKRLGAKAFRYYINHLHEAAEKLQVLCATCNQIKAYENREHNKSRRVVKVR